MLSSRWLSFVRTHAFVQTTHTATHSCSCVRLSHVPASIDGPHKATPQGLGWYHFDMEATPVTYSSVKEGLDAIEKAVATQGPFDGILGFSQGGALAAMALAANESTNASSESLSVVVVVMWQCGVAHSHTRLRVGSSSSQVSVSVWHPCGGAAAIRPYLPGVAKPREQWWRQADGPHLAPVWREGHYHYS